MLTPREQEARALYFLYNCFKYKKHNILVVTKESYNLLTALIKRHNFPELKVTLYKEHRRKQAIKRPELIFVDEVSTVNENIFVK